MSYFNSDGAAATDTTAGTVIVPATSALTVDASGNLDEREPVIDVYNTGTGATWTKPDWPHWVRIELWGGGGSGGNGVANGPGGGGGGGAYNMIEIPFSYLVGAVTYTVGAGGTGQSTGSSVGNAGGASSVSIAEYNGTCTTFTLSAFGGGRG